MQKGTTATPTNTASPKTRRILRLVFSGGTHGHHTLLRAYQTADSTVSLHWPGPLHNVTSCQLSSSELRSLPELRGSTQTELVSPNFYLPSRIPTITDHEAQQLEAIVPADTKKLDYISSHVLAQKQTYDVDSVFQLRSITIQHERKLQWYMTLTTFISVAIFLGLFSFLMYTHFPN